MLEQIKAKIQNYFFQKRIEHQTIKENKGKPIPRFIKARIYESIARSVFICVLFIGLMFIFKTVNAFCIVTPIVISLLYLYVAYRFYVNSLFDMYIEIKGIVIEVEQVGVLKVSKRQRIKMTDTKKVFLSFDYYSDKEVPVGTPVTLYLFKNEEIKMTSSGPYVENVVSIEFDASEIGQDITEITADDFFNTK